MFYSVYDSVSAKVIFIHEASTFFLVGVNKYYFTEVTVIFFLLQPQTFDTEIVKISTFSRFHFVIVPRTTCFNF